MTQPVSASGADGETPCKTIEVRNKYKAVLPTIQVAILVGVDSSNIFNLDLQILKQNTGSGGPQMRVQTIQTR